MTNDEFKLKAILTRAEAATVQPFDALEDDIRSLCAALEEAWADRDTFDRAGQMTSQAVKFLVDERDKYKAALEEILTLSPSTSSGETLIATKARSALKGEVK